MWNVESGKGGTERLRAGRLLATALENLDLMDSGTDDFDRRQKVTKETKGGGRERCGAARKSGAGPERLKHSSVRKNLRRMGFAKGRSLGRVLYLDTEAAESFEGIRSAAWSRWAGSLRFAAWCLDLAPVPDTPDGEVSCNSFYHP